MRSVLVKGVRRAAAALGVAASLAILAVTGSPVVAAPGDLDQGFAGGSHGRVAFNLGNATGHVADVVVQPGGGIVTVGRVGSATGTDAVAARFHADGTRDPRFGTVKLPVPTEANEIAKAAVAQSDGKIVVVGTVTDALGRADFGVWRLKPSGGVDTSFGNNGFVEIGDPSTNDLALGVALDGRGRILIAGMRLTVDTDMAVVRLTPSGRLDDTFNNGLSFLVVDHAGGNDAALAVAVQSDGRIVLGGVYGGVAGNVAVRIIPGTATAPAVLDGDFGGGFGVAGIADVPGTTNSDGADVAVGADGNILLLTRAPTPGGPTGATDVTVVRLTSTGDVDDSYGSADGTGAHIDTNDGGDTGSALTLLPHGGVAVAGTLASTSRAFVAKFRTGGALDPGMGPGGVRTLAKGAASGVAALPDGRIIAAGDLAASDHANFVYRLIGDLQAPSCAGRRATITGTKSPDRLVGTRRPDVVAGLGGGDTITGLGKGDIVCGGKGADHITGRAGSDRLYGQAGRDTLTGGPGDDRLIGGAGRDRLRGGPGHDTLKQ